MNKVHNIAERGTKAAVTASRSEQHPDRQRTYPQKFSKVAHNLPVEFGRRFVTLSLQVKSKWP